jgi:predicted ester cyclase
MEPRDVVRRFVEEYQTAGDERAFAELLHPDVIDHSRPPGIAPGALGVRQQFDGIHLIDIVRVADGRIVEHWNCVDRLGLLSQLGALPA